MATWGRTTKKPAKKPAASRPRASAPKSSTNGTKSAVAADDRTREMPVSRRQQAGGELRGAVDGREDEFVGIALIAAGVLLALAIYFDLAGVLGEAISKVVGWFTGVARYLVPIALVCIGVALVRRGRSEHRYRLIVGWGLGVFAVLGLLHVFRGPDSVGGLDEVGRAGGWVGALVGAPLRSLLATPGATVVLLAALIGAILLITGTSIKALFGRGSTGVSALSAPAGKAVAKARHVFGNMASLKSERDATPGGTPLPAPMPPPRPYDADADDDWSDVAPKRTRRPKALPPPVVGPTEQVELELGPGAQRGQWLLPPANYLTRSAAHAVNQAEVEARGRTLVESLNSHGVDVRLIGQTVGPTVTRYELELGSGVKVARVPSLNRDIAYAMAATDVRILAPIPGRSAIGVEVPNHTRQLVSLGDIMGSAEAKSADAPARRRRRQGHRRPLGVPQPGHHAAPADRRHHRRRQVQRDQLHHHVAADAHHARAGPADPRRPQAGRDGPVQPAAAPAHPAGHQPEEGGQRAAVGVQGDGAPLRRAVRGRLPRHRRVQRRVRPWRPAAGGVRARRHVRRGCRTSSSSSTSSTT